MHSITFHVWKYVCFHCNSHCRPTCILDSNFINGLNLDFPRSRPRDKVLNSSGVLGRWSQSAPVRDWGCEIGKWRKPVKKLVQVITLNKFNLFRAHSVKYASELSISSRGEELRVIILRLPSVFDWGLFLQALKLLCATLCMQTRESSQVDNHRCCPQDAATCHGMCWGVMAECWQR